MGTGCNRLLLRQHRRDEVLAHDAVDLRAPLVDVLGHEGRLQQLAVKRHLADLKSAAKRGFFFSEGHAVEAIEFIQSCCRHSKGQQFASKPVILTPSQKFIVWCLFGWRRSSDELRRFKKAYLSMARKWGKSTFAACIAILLAVFDNPLEPGAEVYSTATKEAQAAIVHGEAKRMVEEYGFGSIKLKAGVFEPDFEIESIRALLKLSDKPDMACDDAHAIASAHLGDVRDKIARLRLLEGELQRIATSCAGGVSACDCAIIEALADHGQCHHDHGRAV